MHHWYFLDYGVTIKAELPRKIRRLDGPWSRTCDRVQRL